MKILCILDNDTFKEDLFYVAEKVKPYANMVWYRVKNIEKSIIADNCKKLRLILPETTLILSSYIDIAIDCNFNGVHFNKSTYNQEIIRKYNNMIFGYSAHSIEECRNIESHYKTLSPIFQVNKPFYTKPLGLFNIDEKNIYALGGININNYKSLINRGFTGIAGISLCRNIEKYIF